MRPRILPVAIWLLLIAGTLIAFKTGSLDAALRSQNLARAVKSPAFGPVFSVVLFSSVFGGAILLARVRRTRARKGYVKALASPTPDLLLQLIERLMRRSRLHPEVDALTAQSKAIACSLYGQGTEARRALAQVNWKSKPPLVQAIGLSAEGLVALLCDRDVEGALEITRKARAMSSISSLVPGATQSERYYNTCVAVAEVLKNVESATSLKNLEEAAADQRFPPLQLVASFGLAVAAERAGNERRAFELRTFVKTTAPYCAPLQLLPSEFSLGTERTQRASAEGPVSTALSDPSREGSVTQQQAAKRKIVKTVVVIGGLWILLLALLAISKSFFSQ